MYKKSMNIFKMYLEYESKVNQLIIIKIWFSNYF